MTMTAIEMTTELTTRFGLNEAQAAHTIDALENNGDLDDDVYEILFDHYCSNGEMPYGTATAKDGDPIEWVFMTIGDDLGMGF